MSEPVRLVIWDLDETFWRGTLTEGGIQEYVSEHHNIVIELAKRGIMSSICSKNDPDIVSLILSEQNIQDYFIFPNISWQPKGPRLANLIEMVQLRAATVMFIDDNPNNRGEAKALVPGIQVESETFIGRMLSDPRFQGHPDPGLVRLKQYKMLELRKKDEKSISTSNEDFLRSCDIRVYIEYDVETHIDRAVELINRTNQLNFTKQRLPEDIPAAKDELRRQMAPFDASAGLVHVRDRYGDYGFIGFFMTHGMRKTIVEGCSNTHLSHFCFSCRTLGMLVERWIYDYLGRPELPVAGDVLTDLHKEQDINWIRQVTTSDPDVLPSEPLVERLVLWGGCETAAMFGYLATHAGQIEVFGNYEFDGVLVSANFASRILDRFDQDDPRFGQEVDLLGLPEHLELENPFNANQGPTLFVVNLSDDAKGCEKYRHNEFDWSIRAAPLGHGYDLFSVADQAEFDRRLQAGPGHYSAAQADLIRNIHKHLQEFYYYQEASLQSISDAVSETNLLLQLIPQNCKIIVVTPHSEERSANDPSEIQFLSRVEDYKVALKTVVDTIPYAATISFSDVLAGHDEMLESNHFVRSVYLRMSQAIMRTASHLPARSDKPLSKRRLLRSLNEHEYQRRLSVFASDMVDATFDVLLRRPIDAEKKRHESQRIASGEVPGGWFIRAVSKSEEFTSKWSPTMPATSGAHIALNDFGSLRVPNDLARTALIPRRVILVGSCLSETIKDRMQALPEPCAGELYFVGSELPHAPQLPPGEYDFQIVQLALRFVLPDNAFARLGQLDKDGHQTLFEHTASGMRRHLDMAMKWNRDHGLLTFVLPFIEPVQNPAGRLMPRFDLRNPVYFIERLNEAMGRELEAYRNAFFVDINEVLSHHGRRFSQEDVFMSFNHGGFLGDFDANHDLNRLEPTGKASELFGERLSEFFTAFWQELVGLQRTVLQLDPIKLVIVDLDDTMWRGVMAEAEPDDLPTSEGWPLGFWEALLLLKRRGVMLAILSKNEEKRVDELWPKVFGRRIQPDDFVVRMINWKPKTENMTEILSRVNLLSRNVLYIDDNPVERAAIQSAFPEMRVLGGSPLQWRRILLWSPETQVAHVTAESATRTTMVRAQVHREDHRKSLPHEEFLASLQVKLTFFSIGSTEHPRFVRVLELINKTNQFNTTGRRWTRDEFVRHFARGHSVFAFEVEDRYTQYGLVGVLVVMDTTIVQVVMSCRVLGLGVEQAVLALASEAMTHNGSTSITGLMVATDRNQPCRDLYASCGFKPIDGGWHRLADPRLPSPKHVKVTSRVREELRPVANPDRARGYPRPAIP